MLSTNVDTSGHPFVSTIEAKDVPVYAVQWHPERPQFDWTYGGKLNHGAEAIEAMSWMSRLFIGEARKNGRSFATDQEEERADLQPRHRLGSVIPGTCLRESCNLNCEKFPL